MSVMALAISVASLAYITYAWFYFQHAQDLNFLKVNVEQGVTYSLKHLQANNAEGYKGPSLIYGDESIVTVTDYSSDFTDVSPHFHEFYLPLKQPYYRLTYALEVNIEPSAIDQVVEVAVISYESPPSLHFYDVDTEEAITLAQAINIYSHTSDGNMTNTEITAEAKTFVEALTPASGDVFDESEEMFLLATTLAEASETAQTKIIFFTIEFDGDPSTFYKFASKDNGDVFYEKSTLGNSNVYQGLTFTIETIEIRKHYDQ